MSNLILNSNHLHMTYVYRCNDACVYTHVSTYTHKCMHATYTYTRVHAFIHTYIHVHTSVHMHTRSDSHRHAARIIGSARARSDVTRAASPCSCHATATAHRPWTRWRPVHSSRRTCYVPIQTSVSSTCKSATHTRVYICICTVSVHI